jgi:hypothetical protein
MPKNLEAACWMANSNGEFEGIIWRTKGRSVSIAIYQKGREKAER